jgi:CheY-like chemotaxis protein
MGDKNLLVMIDDDSDDHEIFLMALEEIARSYEVLQFFDCEQALQHFTTPGSQQPGFVFVDINLPRIGGPECISRLQQLGRFNKPRVIIYSSSIPQQWKGKLEQGGFDGFLKKTGSLSDLKEKLAAILSAS